MKFKRKSVVLLLTAALLLSSRTELFAADPTTYPLSRDHVNLVRVQGQKITDVVYDTQALEISADKARGIVFVKVRPAWLANAQGDVTSAFFNTQNENFAVQFLVSSVPSQTVDLVPQSSAPAAAADTELKIALAAPLLQLEAGDFERELKLLVEQAFDSHNAAAEPGVGALSQAGQSERFARMPVPEGWVVWEGFKVRETRAFVTADKLVETLLFTRVWPEASVPDAARLAQAVPSVVAVAQEIRDETRDRLQTEMTLIRSRQGAVRGSDFFESALTALSSDKRPYSMPSSADR